MKESNPMRMVSTFHPGFQSSAWKSDMDKHMRVFVLKRPVQPRIQKDKQKFTEDSCIKVTSQWDTSLPFGVSILMAGGFMGKETGNSNTP